MTNKEKFLALVSKEETDTMKKNTERIKNRAALRESQQMDLLERIISSFNFGWKLKPLDGKTEYPVGSYFVYQKKLGPPIVGGTQPIWSYDMTEIVALWEAEGGYVFDENGKILRKDG